jgi:anhydro-N-acetylmuramic acid kinase
MISSRQFHILGMMSGTSLDGLDLAYCTFALTGNQWKYEIRAAETVSYAASMHQRLSDAMRLSGEELVQLHFDYGTLCGNVARDFIRRHGIDVQHISAHGHTVFHQPQKGMTFQIGSGAAMASASGIPVICDFRSGDVALGGQGAPLVPVGDQWLFASYSHCLNIGGIANISFEKDGKRIAGDICPANMALNFYSRKKGWDYDEGGKFAASGNLIPSLLERLNRLPFYQLPFPKSLGREWVEREFFILSESYGAPVEDIMHTLCEHMAMQIAAFAGKENNQTMLVTGGGALNEFLLERIKHHCNCKIHVPDMETILFKEALIFAFLGVLRLRGEPNCMSSVTGARHDHSSGCIYL